MNISKIGFGEDYRTHSRHNKRRKKNDNENSNLQNSDMNLKESISNRPIILKERTIIILPEKKENNENNEISRLDLQG